MRVLLRCDGGGSLGVGHVMRSLALAEAAVAAGHEVVVAGHFEGSFILGQLAAAAVKVVEIGSLRGDGPQAHPHPILELFGRFDPDVIHTDSYDLSWWLMGSMLFSNLEDGAFGRRSAAVVIDPTFGAELTPRPADASTWLLRGSRFTPIRQRVLEARKQFADVAEPAETVGTIADSVAPSTARSVLVVMGGTDPAGLAPVAVGLLARTGLALDVTVIAVGENADRVRAAAAGTSLALTVVAPVDDLATLMARQDLVVSAAGTSVWELCCLGVPMAVIWAVDNQREGYDRVVAAGAAVGLGGPELAQDRSASGEQAVELLTGTLKGSKARADLARTARTIVDGLGAWRVVRTWEQALRQAQRQASNAGPRHGNADPSHGNEATSEAVPTLVARPATIEDARILWEWRNDPVTRAASRHGDRVPWLEHLAWVGAGLGREDRLLLVVEAEAGPVGTVRWDLEQPPERENAWEVSITVAPERRGQSLSRPLLRAGEAALSQQARVSGTAVAAYLAVVHVDNAASVRLFESERYLPDLPPDAAGFMRFRKPARVT